MITNAVNFNLLHTIDLLTQLKSAENRSFVISFPTISCKDSKKWCEGVLYSLAIIKDLGIKVTIKNPEATQDHRAFTGKDWFTPKDSDIPFSNTDEFRRRIHELNGNSNKAKDKKYDDLLRSRFIHENEKLGTLLKPLNSTITTLEGVIKISDELYDLFVSSNFDYLEPSVYTIIPSLINDYQIEVDSDHVGIDFLDECLEILNGTFHIADKKWKELALESITNLAPKYKQTLPFTVMEMSLDKIRAVLDNLKLPNDPMRLLVYFHKEKRLRIKEMRLNIENPICSIIKFKFLSLDNKNPDELTLFYYKSKRKLVFNGKAISLTHVLKEALIKLILGKPNVPIKEYDTDRKTVDKIRSEIEKHGIPREFLKNIRGEGFYANREFCNIVVLD